MNARFLKKLCVVVFTCVLPHMALAGANCNESLKDTESKIASLSSNDISAFFQSFNKECLKSAEFGEWSNELLFSVLAKQPTDFAAVLGKQDVAHTNAILLELESPINDGIDIKAIHASVKSVKSNSRMKQRIIQALRVAAGKSGTVLQ